MFCSGYVVCLIRVIKHLVLPYFSKEIRQTASRVAVGDGELGDDLVASCFCMNEFKIAIHTQGESDSLLMEHLSSSVS